MPEAPRPSLRDVIVTLNAAAANARLACECLSQATMINEGIPAGPGIVQVRELATMNGKQQAVHDPHQQARAEAQELERMGNVAVGRLMAACAQLQGMLNP